MLIFPASLWPLSMIDKIIFRCSNILTNLIVKNKEKTNAFVLLFWRSGIKKIKERM